MARKQTYTCANRLCGCQVKVNGYVPPHSVVCCGTKCHNKYLEQQNLFMKVLAQWEPQQRLN